MEVSVTLYAQFADYLPAGSKGRAARLSLPEGSTVFAIIETLGIPFEVEEGVLVAAIGGQVVDLHAPLSDGMEVSLFPPLQGGAPCPRPPGCLIAAPSSTKE